MALKTLDISDLHFGSGQDLLAHPAFLERLEPELQWADQLLVNGDMFELIFSSLQNAIDSSRPFANMVSKYVEKLILVVGNHDHHLVASTADQRRFEDAVGIPDKHPFHVTTAEMVLHHLCPDIEVFAAYPATTIDDIYFIHGHYLTQHLAAEGFGWKMWDNLQWKLSGTKRRHDGLSIQDYEALLTPLYELMYSTSQLPSGSQTKAQSERLLAIAGAVLSTPGKVGQQAIKIEQALMTKFYSKASIEDEQALLDPPPAATRMDIIDAMALVCSNLGIPPGPVVFGHTHFQMQNPSADTSPWQFYNSGSWTMSDTELNHPEMREHSWPGAVLRVEGQSIELHNLLTDMSVAEIAKYSGRAKHAKRRRRA